MNTRWVFNSADCTCRHFDDEHTGGGCDADECECDAAWVEVTS